MSSNGSSPTPITDVVAEWLDNQSASTRGTLRALGELLGYAAEQTVAEPERAEAFTARMLGVPGLDRVSIEERDLGPVTCLSSALALGEWLYELPHEIGPYRFSDPPAFGETEVGDDTYAHPLCLRVGFPAGSAADVPVVLAFNGRRRDRPCVTAYTRPGDREAAGKVLTRLLDRADELNPLRGRALRASWGGGMTLDVIDLPTVTRDAVILPDSVWREADIAIRAVHHDHELLTRAGLPCSYGLLTVGPPGVGKTSLATIVARELVDAGFTAIRVDGRAAGHILGELLQEANRTLAPSVITVDDIDLIAPRGRASGAAELSTLLEALEIAGPDARQLVLMSTNSTDVLDPALLRRGRVDAVCTLTWPTAGAAGEILRSRLEAVPGGSDVDVDAVVAALPAETSGADLTDVCRRALLSGAGRVTTELMLAEVASGARVAAAAAGGGAYL